MAELLPSASGSRKVFMTLVYGLMLLYVSLCVFMYVKQRSLLYYPDTAIGQPAQYGLENMQVLRLRTQDGVNIVSWYAPPPAASPVVVYFHGNGGNLGHRHIKFREFLSRGYGVLGVSYRGFGDSEGLPSEQGIYKDARAAIQYLLEQGIRERDIVLYGESLGSGVAIQMATEYDVKLVALQAPYTSIKQLASEIYPWLPVRLLLKDVFDSLGKIQKVSAPVFIVHGEMDGIVPVHHGKTLFEALSVPKKALWLPRINHNDIDARTAVAGMDAFLKEVSSL